MSRGRSAISVSILLALTAAVYLRPSIFLGDQALNGVDYFAMHIKRIAFAQDALFGPGHFVPAWYPREFLGAPFSADPAELPLDSDPPVSAHAGRREAPLSGGCTACGHALGALHLVVLQALRALGDCLDGRRVDVRLCRLFRVESLRGTSSPARSLSIPSTAALACRPRHGSGSGRLLEA